MSVKQQGSIKLNYKLKELRVDVYFEMSQLISLTSISFLSFFFSGSNLSSRGHLIGNILSFYRGMESATACPQFL